MLVNPLATEKPEDVEKNEVEQKGQRVGRKEKPQKQYIGCWKDENSVTYTVVLGVKMDNSCSILAPFGEPLFDLYVKLERVQRGELMEPTTQEKDAIR